MDLLICPHCRAPINPGDKFCTACGGTPQFDFLKPDNPYARNALTLSIVTAAVLQLGNGIAKISETLGVLVFFVILAILLSIKAISLARMGMALADEERIYGRGMSISAIVVAILVMAEAVLDLGMFVVQEYLYRRF